MARTADARLARTCSHLVAAASSTQRPPLDPPPRVLRIVLTGGPCGGKTTSLPIIADELRSRGIPTATVAETAT